MEALIGAAIIVVAGLFTIPWLKDMVEVSRTRVVEMPPNSNEEAQRIFLDLLEEASTEILMYDDGNAQDGSLYQSQQVVQAIRNKIRDIPSFRVRCVLNSGNGSTLFESALAAEPNVTIRPRDDNPSRVHYKIIDGRKAYVSCHQPGMMARTRRMIDCTNSQSRRGRHPLALQRYFDDFERPAA